MTYCPDTTNLQHYQKHYTESKMCFSYFQLVVLSVVAAANCAAVLKNVPSNARVEYE